MYKFRVCAEDLKKKKHICDNNINVCVLLEYIKSIQTS